MQGFKQHLIESSLARIYSKTKDFDTGAMSAFRGEFTKAENMERNKKVLAYLLSKGYSVTKVKGSYIENHKTDTAREVGEESFFVADHDRKGTLKADLIKLGRLYDQDSILWVAKGQAGVLIGTSKRDNAFPSYNKSFTVGKPIFGKATGEFFSRVKGRQFAFEQVEDITEMTVPDNINGKWAMTRIAESVECELAK